MFHYSYLAYESLISFGMCKYLIISGSIKIISHLPMAKGVGMAYVCVFVAVCLIVCPCV